MTLAARRRQWQLVLPSLSSLLISLFSLFEPSLYSAVQQQWQLSYPDGWVPNDRELVRSPHSGASMQRHFMTASWAEWACVGLHSVAATTTSKTRRCRLGPLDIGTQLPFHLRCYKLPLMCRCRTSLLVWHYWKGKMIGKGMTNWERYD